VPTISDFFGLCSSEEAYASSRRFHGGKQENCASEGSKVVITIPSGKGSLEIR
jgi:hypothetical protein